MKYFLVSLVQQDGEHEHVNKYLAKGQTENVVRNRVSHEQLYDAGERGHENSMLDYCDGTTAVYKYHLQELPQDHYELMLEHHYMYEI